jgi:uncharacterized protein (DUF58 family)
MTRNRIILVVLWVAAGIFASFYGGSIPYALFYMVLLVPVISFLYTLYVFVRFKLFQEISERTLVKGEATDYSFRLANEDFISYQQIQVRFFTGMSTIPDVSEAESYCLQPGEIKKVDARLACNYRGSYAVGVQSILIGDLFNLFHFRYPILTKLQVVVLPRIVRLEHFGIIPLDSDSKRSMFSVTPRTDELDIEVRKYDRGDSLRQIHWKNTARRGEFMSRKFGEELRLGVVLCMDLTPTGEKEMLARAELEDRVIESTISIAEYCLRTATPCSVHYCDGAQIKQMRLNSRADFDLFYHECGQLSFKAESDCGALVEAGRLADTAARYIILTHGLSESLFSQVSRAAAHGCTAAVILFADALDEREQILRAYLAQSGIRLLQIHRDEDFAQVFSNTQE